MEIVINENGTWNPKTGKLKFNQKLITLTDKEKEKLFNGELKFDYKKGKAVKTKKSEEPMIETIIGLATEMRNMKKEIKALKKKINGNKAD